MQFKKSLKYYLLNYNSKLLDISLLLLRLSIGIILFVLGAGKVFGWFGGQGLSLTVSNFVKMGISAPLTYISCYTELFGGLLIFLGLFTRPSAFFVAINMIVATSFMLPRGFFKGGAAYPFTIMIIAIVVLISGPMKISLDHLIFGKSQR